MNDELRSYISKVNDTTNTLAKRFLTLVESQEHLTDTDRSQFLKNISVLERLGRDPMQDPTMLVAI